MPNIRKFSSAQETEIVRLYKEGLTLAQIGCRFGCSEGPVRAAIKRSGMKLRPKSYRSSPKVWTDCACGNTAIYSSGVCRPCYDRRRRENPELQDHLFNKKLTYRFNITIGDYLRLLEEQGGTCAICKQPPEGARLGVDHDHKCCPAPGKSCGKCVRALLCVRCNTALGSLKEDMGYAENLVSFIRKFIPQSPAA